MGKFGVLSKVEDKAIEMMIGQKKDAVEVSKLLKEQGHEYSPQQLRKIKENAFETLVDEERGEAMADFLLESVKKVTFEFEDLFARYKKLADRYETEGKPFEQTIVLKELKDMLHMSLKKLGEYKHGIEQIRTTNVNIISNSDVMVAMQQNQDRWFNDMEPEMKEGKLIFNRPLPEVVDAYHKWNFKQGKARIL